MINKNIYRTNSPLRTGRTSKRLDTTTVVPVPLDTGTICCRAPDRENDRLDPTSSSAVFVTIEKLSLSSQSAFRASPRKPNDETEAKSEKEPNFEVQCFNAILS